MHVGLMQLQMNVRGIQNAESKSTQAKKKKRAYASLTLIRENSAVGGLFWPRFHSQSFCCFCFI